MIIKEIRLDESDAWEIIESLQPIKRLNIVGMIFNSFTKKDIADFQDNVKGVAIEYFKTGIKTLGG